VPTALVTGGGGFLGLYITEQLRERGINVRVYCRRRHPQLEKLGVEWSAGDVRDAEQVIRACEGVDVVFHTAGLPGIWGPWRLYHETNTQGTLNVIEGCRKHAIPKLVFTSSASVVFDGSPHNHLFDQQSYPPRYLCHYSHSKAIAERAVLAANGNEGMTTVALRPHLIWGPRDNHLVPRLIARARAGRLRRVGDGTNLISIVYVENAAAAHLQAADVLAPDSPAAGQAYFVNEPAPVNLWEWINELLKRAGLPPVTKTMSLNAAWRGGALLEALHWLFRRSGEPTMTRFLALQLATTHYYDHAKAERDFGYKTLVDVNEGLRRLEPELRRLGTQ